MKRYEKVFIWLCGALIAVSLLVGVAIATSPVKKGATLNFDGQSYAIDRASTIVIQSENAAQTWDGVTATTHTVTVTIYLLPEQP